MSTRALTIVEEEVQRMLEECDAHGIDAAASHHINILKDRLTRRLEEECIDIPCCEDCVASPADGKFGVQEGEWGPSYEKLLCEGCHESRRSDGYTVWPIVPKPKTPEQGYVPLPQEDDIPF